MSGITLTILGDASGVKRAFGQVVSAQRSANAALSADDRATSERRRRGYDTDAKAAERAEKEKTRAAQREAKERQRVEAAADREKKKIADRAARDAEAAEKAKTRATAQESKLRAQLAAQETRTWEEEARERIRSQERAEQRVTRDVERYIKQRKRLREQEARERDANDRENRSRGGAVGQALYGAGSQFASAAHGIIQGARTEVASIDASVSDAVYQSGGGRSDITHSTQRVMEFAREHNMSSSEIASALQAAQTEFSVLGDKDTSSDVRNRRVETFLQTALLARNTGNNVTEFGRLAGLFNDTGMDPETQRRLMLYTAGAAQRGSIEAGAVTRTAMSSIRRRIGQAIARAQHAGTNPQAAAEREYRQAFAELEVAKGAGETPIAAGNAIASMNVALGSNVSQENMYTNIAHVEDRALRGRLQTALFDTDRSGHHRLKAQYHDSLALMQAFGANGVDMETFMNITRGGGHGNPMSLLSNQRRVLGELLNPDVSGRRGIERITDIMNTAALGETDVARGAEAFGQSDAARLTRQHEDELSAASDTGLAGRMSNAYAQFTSEHPFMQQAMTTAELMYGGKAAHWLGSVFGGRIGAAVGARGGVGGLMSRAGSAISGLFGAAAAPAAAVAGSVLTYTGDSLVTGDEEAEMIRRHRATGGASSRPVLTAGASQEPAAAMGARGFGFIGAIASALPRSIGEAVADSVRRAFAENPPVVRMDAADAVHNTTRQGTGSGAAP